MAAVQGASITGLLQWGRDLSVAEGVGAVQDLGIEVLLQWGRDLSVAEGPAFMTRRRLIGRRFNGAATFRSRKGGPALRAVLHAHPALMGPRPFGRGRRGRRAGFGN